MPVVTSLDPAGGGRTVVSLDGERAMVVGQALVARWRLHVDKELSTTQVAELAREAARDAALADAHRMLAHRSRSEREITSRLLAKGHTEEAIAAVVDRLRRDGLLDDAAFAAAYVADKRRLSGRGRERIAAELSQAGVAAEVIESALGPDDAEAEVLRALEILRKAPLADVPAVARRRRAFARLRRRGFSAGVALSAVDRWMGGQGASDVPEDERSGS